MLLLETKNIPVSAAELTHAANAWLRGRINRADGVPMVACTGEFPSLPSLVLNLNDGEIDTRQTPPDARLVGPTQDGPVVGSLTILAQRLRAMNVSMNGQLSAKEAKLRFGKNAAGQVVVILDSAKSGEVAVGVSRKDLESAALIAARAGAAGTGIEVKSLQLQLKSIDPRTVGIEALVTAKKFMTAVVRVRGTASVDDRLRLTLSGLAADGDGMVGSLAAGLLKPQLQKLEGNTLNAMEFGRLALASPLITLGETVCKFQAEILQKP